MSADANKEFIRQYLADFRADPSQATIDRYIAEDELKQHIAMYNSVIPGYYLDPEDILAEGDKVAVRAMVRGVHTGPFMGTPPTGKAATSTARPTTTVPPTTTTATTPSTRPATWVNRPAVKVRKRVPTVTLTTNRTARVQLVVQRWTGRKWVRAQQKKVTASNRRTTPAGPKTVRATSTAGSSGSKRSRSRRC